MPLSTVLDILSTISGFFPVLVAFYNYKNLDKVLKIAALFFLISSLFDPLMWVLANNGAKNNMPLIHVNIIVTVVFFAVIYYKLFTNRVQKKTTVILSVITLGIMLIYNWNFLEYPSISSTASAILLIILSLFYFYKLLNPLKYIDIEKQGLFWINAGVLFYSSVNIFLFMIFTQIPVDDRPNYYVINSISNIIANILYSVGLFCKPQKTA
ncbi:hypothetical protein SNE25_01100 [Mucilaginibacter sabulilitoris]|uniref:Uncharacterized protein n=1 Tax=Mucilaginibacter sabulilitoris TaxID=1173583 RepID=A0ABZ0TMN4_9SPHI|nr:hypothetical protein [Mucilaginibacter sabulilitoris]WPU94119.1 hypothetical protein SNE25_01100 [Mucilaginibacter sabulilitoris]